MIYTERLHIRKFQSDDFEELFNLLSDDVVMEKIETPYTREMTETFLHQCALSDSPLIYAVEDQTKEFIGYVIYHPCDSVSYEIGWVLKKSQWGRGYASELTQFLIADAHSKTSNLVIECLPSQVATRKIAIKHQFSFVEKRDGLDVYMLHINKNF